MKAQLLQVVRVSKSRQTIRLLLLLHLIYCTILDRSLLIVNLIVVATFLTSFAFVTTITSEGLIAKKDQVVGDDSASVATATKGSAATTTTCAEWYSVVSV
jgi:hypothetical protein